MFKTSDAEFKEKTERELRELESVIAQNANTGPPTDATHAPHS